MLWSTLMLGVAYASRLLLILWFVGLMMLMDVTTVVGSGLRGGDSPVVDVKPILHRAF